MVRPRVGGEEARVETQFSRFFFSLNSITSVLLSSNYARLGSRCWKYSDEQDKIIWQLPFLLNFYSSSGGVQLFFNCITKRYL